MTETTSEAGLYFCSPVITEYPIPKTWTGPRTVSKCQLATHVIGLQEDTTWRMP